MTVALAGSDVAARIEEAVPHAVLEATRDHVALRAERIAEVCRFLKEAEGLAFDFLEGVSAVDFIDHFTVVYHLLSLRHNHSLVLRVQVHGREEPSVPSVTPVWRGADLQEREVYDLMGIAFTGHPNMKRVLLWDGFQGYPLRKDFL
jgi:NADH-quinone oxidoreductase subunit C